MVCGFDNRIGARTRKHGNTEHTGANQAECKEPVRPTTGEGTQGFSGFPRRYLHLAPAGPHTKLALKVVFVALSAGLALWCLRTRDWLTATGWCTFFLLVTMGWVLPWYIWWLLPVAALARSRLLVPATVALTVAIAGIWSVHYLREGHHRHSRAQHSVVRHVAAEPGVSVQPRP